MPRWLLLALALTLAGGILVWTTLVARDPISVRVVEVDHGTVESTITNTKAGTVRARLRAQLSSQVGGVVVAIECREGDRVATGAALVRLDDATHQAQLTLARESLKAADAAYREACIQRERARRELERKRELADQRIVSDDLLDALESAHQMASAACNRASAEVGRSRAQVQASEVELAKLVLRAPFDGVVAEMSVEVGEWITPSPPLLSAPAVVDIIDPSSLYISAPMDEVDSAAIRSGQQVKVTVDSFPDRVFTGVVTRVAPYVLDVEAQNRTVEIEVELLDEQLAAQLLPGTSADVEVVLELREAVLRIPTAALLAGDRVLIAGNGRLEEQRVATGIKNWDYAEVTEGLERGQQVVVSLDRAEVQPGAKVEAEVIEYRP